MWAAPNELEGPGGLSDGRSPYETDVRAPQKLEAAEMRSDWVVSIAQCLQHCLKERYEAFRMCMISCMKSVFDVSENTKMKRHDDHY